MTLSKHARIDRAPSPVNTIIRTGRGKMMGVEWLDDPADFYV